MSSPVEPSYRTLQVAARAGLGRAAVTPLLLECVRESLSYLATSAREDLDSSVAGKDYFAFVTTTPKRRTSRGINRALFDDDIGHVTSTLEALLGGTVPQDAGELHAALYTAAIGFPAAIDITKDGDKKSPGTYLEMLVGHLVSSMFGVQPTKSVVAPTLDLQINLPTDFVFDLGAGKSRIHLPVKAQCHVA